MADKENLIVETTPNPLTRKFLASTPISPEGPLAFDTVAEAGVSPLAKAIFDVDGVAGVFLGQNFISVSKKADISWETLLEPLKKAITQALQDKKPVWEVPSGTSGHHEHSAHHSAHPSHHHAPAEEGSVEYEIQNLLNERIRPFVAQDGGDIAFDSFKDGVVYLRMHGACQGCPSASATLKQGVENMLRHFIPEVQEVKAIA